MLVVVLVVVVAFFDVAGLRSEYRYRDHVSRQFNIGWSLISQD